MSQSPVVAEKSEELKSYLQNWNNLSSMIRQGQSFSGRERNCAFLNVGQGRWADISAASGIDFDDDGRAIALTDWDGDGDVDLWIANRTGPRIRFLRNQLQSRHDYLRIRLVGVQANRDAIGARVALNFADGSPSLVKTLRAGGGFVSQSSKWLHFGLGSGRAIESISVRWPNGTITKDYAVRANGSYRVEQATGEVALVAQRSDIVLSKDRPSDQVPQAPPATRVMLTRRIEIPKLRYQNERGVEQDVPRQGKPVLVTLWASWCGTCLDELAALHKHGTQLGEVRVLALCADDLASGITTESTSHASVASKLGEMGDTMEFGVALASTMEALSRAQGQIFYRELPLALPTSFLFDAEGRLAVVYKDPVSVEQLRLDVEIIRQAKTSMFDAFPFPGRSGIEQLPFSPADMAAAYAEGGYWEEAEEELIRYLVETRRAVNVGKVKPTQSLARSMERAYLELGALLRKQGRAEEAQAVLQQGLELIPKSRKLQEAQ